LPVIPYDYRDSSEALVHKDLRLPFDGNRYCVPHRYVGRRLTIKADSSSVTIYGRFDEVVSYARSWRRGQTFGTARFEKLLAEQRPAARRSQAQQRLLDSLDGLCSRSVLQAYLRVMADTDRSLGRQISELLELIRQYGPQDVAIAIEKGGRRPRFRRRVCHQYPAPAAISAPSATTAASARSVAQRTCYRPHLPAGIRRLHS
jgi:hypothetical protein